MVIAHPTKVDKASVATVLRDLPWQCAVTLEALRFPFELLPASITLIVGDSLISQLQSAKHHYQYISPSLFLLLDFSLSGWCLWHSGVPE